MSFHQQPTGENNSFAFFLILFFQRELASSVFVAFLYQGMV